jgi:predicted nucleic acid-binding protein
MPGPLVVLDASVLLKWVLESDDEQDRASALALKHAWLTGACEIAVPQLWTYEVGNILGLKQPARAEALLQSMLNLELESIGPDRYLADIYRLISRHKVTFYDAAYHALAISKGGTLITADAAYVKKTQASGHAVRLADWRKSG